MDAYLLRGLGMLALAQGHQKMARSCLDEAWTIAQLAHDTQAMQTIASLLAERDALEGNAAAVIARLRPLLDAGEHQSDISILLPLLAWAYDAIADTQRADSLLEQALANVDADGNRMERVNVLRAQALIATRQGHWEEAETACAEALALSQKLGLPHAEVKSLYAFGVLDYQWGRLTQARGHLEAGQALCARLGERLYGIQIERALAQLAAR